MQLLNRKYQVPVLAPNDIATINGEKAELAGVKILVVLRVWVTTDEVTYINHSGGIVAECQANGKIACVLSLCNIYIGHSFFINDSAAKIKNKSESSKKKGEIIDGWTFLRE
jgi:hypothetical protein